MTTTTTGEHAIPRGFRAAATAAGIKKSGKPDLALIVADSEATCAGVFTRNQVVAAPVELCRPLAASGRCRAILVNSGNANACTGAPGLAAARESAELVGAALDIAEERVAVCSTGVIGVPLPLAPFRSHVPQLAAALSAERFADVAKAMMTTDAFPKLASRTVRLGAMDCRILALAKGAGMIHPDMATMLCFVLTDAGLDAALADRLLRRAVEASFNRITVDRDTSTNDTVLLLANGAAGAAPLTADAAEVEPFAAALDDLLLELAKMIAKDGEGATKLVRIDVEGARNDDDALKVARSVATSQLVKTALFGQDANWGRIIAAAGYAGAELDQSRVAIRFNEVPMVANGLGLGADQEALATAVMQLPEFTITLSLGLGTGNAYYYTADLGYEYVRINADYRT
ncbi:MAG: bifunctional glutamate N-acetyltransferase/amino-acid acetyltransferase ArgJ [Desulfuromonadales bacterium]|nr:bifunctional glutamate N-acetyltransferase/amino-acid acetyltransferase ArgJ [Desulfuromonadales bacterium]